MKGSDHSAARDARFRSTAWSLIRDARSSGARERAEALERLSVLYWGPVNALIRRRFGFGADEAQDLTQDYFAMLLDGRVPLDQLGPGGGRFRSYIVATVGNFVANHRRASGAMKRGGDRRRVPLSEVGASASGAPDDPDAAFDRDLMHAVIDRALENLAEECRDRGDLVGHELFMRFYVSGNRDEAGYEALRREFDLGPHEVKNRLARLRVAFRRHVLVLLRDGVSSEDELISEIREVFDR